LARKKIRRKAVPAKRACSPGKCHLGATDELTKKIVEMSGSDPESEKENQQELHAQIA
jgi:hypothetical protein